MKYSILIGRFQPFHTGHLDACKQALKQTEHLIILIGSAFSSPSIKNPFSWLDRRTMITKSLMAENLSGKFTTLPIRDYFYSDNTWVAKIQAAIENIVGPGDEVFLVNYPKDDSTYYLNLFPKWNMLKINPKDPGLNATALRSFFFSRPAELDTDLIPKPVFEVLTQYTTCPSWKDYGMEDRTKLDEYERLVEEYRHIQQYKLDWEESPYPPIFNTADAIIVCGGHILLIERKFAPGKGLLALPGGYIRQKETYRAAALRELKEETRLKVPKAVLDGRIVAERTFDYPYRSVRGRVITRGFHIQLDERPLPKVGGGDDAKKAFWMPLNEVYNNMSLFFEDHYQIIESFVGNL